MREKEYSHIRGKDVIGKFDFWGHDCVVQCNDLTIGDHFYCSGGLRVGGGGHRVPNANLTVGDRCVMHNNFINVCEPVVIGDDVGLSPEVSILTHGFWQSVLEGYPAKFAGVTIGNNVIVGYRSVILPGVDIGDNIVIGANSTVTKSLWKEGIYAGNPAKFIKAITLPTPEEQKVKALLFLDSYLDLAHYHGFSPNIELSFPSVRIDDFTVNLITFEYKGIESETTDHFRDCMRKWGIRIYTKRPFG